MDTFDVKSVYQQMRFGSYRVSSRSAGGVVRGWGWGGEGCLDPNSECVGELTPILHVLPSDNICDSI